MTVALDASDAASGEIFWDSGDGEHVMGDSYMCRMNYVDVNIWHSMPLMSYYCSMRLNVIVIGISFGFR